MSYTGYPLLRWHNNIFLHSLIYRSSKNIIVDINVLYAFNRSILHVNREPLSDGSSQFGANSAIFEPTPHRVRIGTLPLAAGYSWAPVIHQLDISVGGDCVFSSRRDVRLLSEIGIRQRNACPGCMQAFHFHGGCGIFKTEQRAVSFRRHCPTWRTFSNFMKKLKCNSVIV